MSSSDNGSSLAQILARTSLLQDCPADLIIALAAEARIVQLAMGQPLQRAGQLPPGPALLLEGRLRRLLAAPGQAPWNLGFIEPGSWVSWTSIWRCEPELTLTASRPSALVLIPAAAALAALRREASLRQALAAPSFEELAVLLAATGSSRVCSSRIRCHACSSCWAKPVCSARRTPCPAVT